MPDQSYVYIMASTFKRLYIGITSEIELRVLQHKEGRYPDSFTSRYKIDTLVHLERFGMVENAIAREKQLKKWSRIKKIQLIVANNPTWSDLSADWGKPIELYPETKQPEECVAPQAKYGGSSTTRFALRSE